MVELKMFELVDALEAGGSAQAQLLKWNGKTYVPFGAMITLHEYVGEYGIADDRGYCFQSPESGQWEVVSGLFAQKHRLVG